MPPPDLRPARPSDISTLERLIAASARELGRGFYTDAEIEAAVAHVYGVDSTLIADGTYLVAEVGGAPVGCGGWSRRATLFGGDAFAGRTSGLLDPARDPARIRAFFVAPGYQRQGVATALLGACETAAAAVGFTRATLMATRPGVPFYAAHGYRAGPMITVDAGGTDVTFVPMSKAVLLQRDTFIEMQYSAWFRYINACDSP